MISDSVKNLGFTQLFVTVVFFVRQYFMAGLIITLGGRFQHYHIRSSCVQCDG